MLLNNILEIRISRTLLSILYNYFGQIKYVDWGFINSVRPFFPDFDNNELDENQKKKLMPTFKT